jgi:ribonuclease BN (tRNA processing enzyme)
MRVTVLGACGAFPSAGNACSGFLVEQDGFRLVLDLGYAAMPRLLRHVPAAAVDAMVISHGHPDHCADLNPLLRARALNDDPAPALPVYAPPKALDAVLALDRPGMLADAIALREFMPGARLSVGPFAVDSWSLPHWMPNAGLRLSAGGRTVAYTGDTGPSPAIVELARDVDLFVAEATYADVVPDDSAQYLSSARQAGQNAAAAGVGRLLLTHLTPDAEREPFLTEAAASYAGQLGIADSGLALEI